MSSPFNLLLFYSWTIRFCEILQRNAVRASGSSNFLAYLALLAALISPLFVLLRSLAFCLHLSWQQWGWKWPNGRCFLACLGKKASVQHNLQGWTCTFSAPGWGVQELPSPITRQDLTGHTPRACGHRSLHQLLKLLVSVAEEHGWTGKARPCYAQPIPGYFISALCYEQILPHTAVNSSFAPLPSYSSYL